MKKFDVAFGLIWLILLLKPETRAADYRAFLNKRGKTYKSSTVVENRRKSLIQHCERSELRLHFEWTKVHKKMPKMANFGENSNATFLVIFNHCVEGSIQDFLTYIL